ncbi:MAG: hypothetical protein ABSG17_07385 [Spirochaetia bacterium]
MDRLTSGGYLLASALIVGALIVGFAFLAGRQDLGRPEWIDCRVVLFAAVASVMWLLGRSVRSAGAGLIGGDRDGADLKHRPSSACDPPGWPGRLPG